MKMEMSLTLVMSTWNSSQCKDFSPPGLREDTRSVRVREPSSSECLGGHSCSLAFQGARLPVCSFGCSASFLFSTWLSAE